MSGPGLLVCVCLLLGSQYGFSTAEEKNNNLLVQQRGQDFPFGDPKNCGLTEGANMFEVLPGGGWDNLRNLEMGQVAFANYSRCRNTEDGKYLIPDSTFALPLKETNLETYADVFDKWTEYTDMTSRSVNADANLFSMISGSFSSSHEEVKKHQYNDNSITTRVQLRRHVYTIKIQPDAQLNPAFKARLMDVAAHIQSNNTRMANYQAQLIIRDFGTHYITSVDVGAILAEEDYIKNTFASDYSLKKSELKAAASASFFGKVGFNAGYGSSTSQEVKKSYMYNTTYSKVKTFGGPAFKVNFTVNDWANDLDNNLVAIDRAGDPIFYAITHATLPEVPDPIRYEVIKLVEKAINQYYKFNTYKGCTTRGSPNFSYQANIDDGSCKSLFTNFTFGGVYQTCSSHSSGAGNLCTSLMQKNPLTGDYSCPDGFEIVQLLTGSDSSTRKDWQCHDSCHHCGFLGLSKCCHQECGNVYYSSSATYSSYWCAATGEVQQEMGFMFGGIFTSHTNNPLTQSQTCPPSFYPLRLGGEMKVCVGDDYELGAEYQVPFAGFFSCTAGNPLSMQTSLTQRKKREVVRTLASFMADSGASSFPHRCAPGYTQHLAGLDTGCEINYCVKANSLSGLSSLQVTRPPFARLPRQNPNSTTTLYIIGPSGNGWARDYKSGEWKPVSFEPMTSLQPNETELNQAIKPGHQLSANRHSKGKGSKLDPGAAAGITIGATAFVGIVIAVIIVSVRYRNKQKRGSPGLPPVSNQYGSFAENQNSEDGV